MQIYLGADHGGLQLKEAIKARLIAAKYPVSDVGAFSLDPADDYPMYALPVAQAVGATDDFTKPWQTRDKGILFCRSGAGMEIAANKVAGIRAAAGFTEELVKFNREHDDINILCLYGDHLTPEAAWQLVEVWLATEFSQEARHLRRLDEITAIEKGTCCGKEEDGCCGGGCCSSEPT